MKTLTRQLIKDFKIYKLGYDFMGYSLQRDDSLTYHHIIPKKDGGLKTYDNGAILFTTPHNYIHIIEGIEPEVFSYVSTELSILNYKGYIDTANIKRIHDALRYFEDKHKFDKTSKGKRLIKEPYFNRRNL